MLDHYLPQSSFPELAYCWENLIPSCEDCNSPRHKGSWSPPRLARGSVKDARAFPTEEGGRALVRVLADQEDRLVHPGLEDPAHHLSFSFRCSRGLSGETLRKASTLAFHRAPPLCATLSPVLCAYQPHSRAGSRTVERFFEERPRWDERVQAINQVARLMVCQPLEGVDDLVVALVAQAEHPHLMDRFLEYWRSLPLPTPPPDL